MVAVADRCHACGTVRGSPDQRFCEKCGGELPVVPEPEAPPHGGISWTYRIPLLNNTYVWRQWGWIALVTGIGSALLFGTLILLVTGSFGSEPLGFLLKVHFFIGLIGALTIIGYALWASLGVGFSVTIRFGLGPERVLGVVTKESADSIRSAAWLFTTDARSAQRNQQISDLLLPSGCEAKWVDVRRADFDERRHVITLRRRWHWPVRVYVPPERFAEAAAFVREHVPPEALARNGARG